MLVVIALRGNALIKRAQPPEVEIQRQNIKLAAQAIAAICNMMWLKKKNLSFYNELFGLM